MHVRFLEKHSANGETFQKDKIYDIADVEALRLVRRNVVEYPDPAQKPARRDRAREGGR